MTHYTLGTPANACGVNKSTVLRAIKAGKVSATRNEHGEWQIDPAEMHRVYPPVAATDAVQQGEERHARPRSATAPTSLWHSCASSLPTCATSATALAPMPTPGARLSSRSARNVPSPPLATMRNPRKQPLQRRPSGRHDCAAPGAGCDDGVRATMDEIGEHAWIISIVGDFLTLFGAYWTARAVLLAPEQAAEIAVGRWDHTEPLKNAL